MMTVATIKPTATVAQATHAIHGLQSDGVQKKMTMIRRTTIKMVTRSP